MGLVSNTPDRFFSKHRNTHIESVVVNIKVNLDNYMRMSFPKYTRKNTYILGVSQCPHVSNVSAANAKIPLHKYAKERKKFMDAEQLKRIKGTRVATHLSVSIDCTNDQLRMMVKGEANQFNAGQFSPCRKYCA